jgi:hypothetical protein
MNQTSGATPEPGSQGAKGIDNSPAPDNGSSQVPVRSDPSSHLTLHYARRTLKMHYVTEPELESLASGATEVNLTFLGMSLGMFVAFALVLVTGTIPDVRYFTSIVSLTWISGISTVYFGAKSFVDHRDARRRLAAIRGTLLTK